MRQIRVQDRDLTKITQWVLWQLGKSEDWNLGLLNMVTQEVPKLLDSVSTCNVLEEASEIPGDLGAILELNGAVTPYS